MNNNDILIRLRYALDIKDIDMVEIFRLGGIEVPKEDVLKMLIKSKDSHRSEADNVGHKDRNEDDINCNNFMLESFLTY